jgi:uncharacterized protein YutE (UPF0331/DUF86 family)
MNTPTSEKQSESRIQVSTSLSPDLYEELCQTKLRKQCNTDAECLRTLVRNHVEEEKSRDKLES